jgi:hypothetical protein
VEPVVFDGCMVFDEVHKAKNLKPQLEGVETLAKGPSKTARHVKAVQALLPCARVVYVSATGCSELKHLSIMDRLGLWGSHSCFDNAAAFASILSGGGVGAMEMLATDLKGRGRLVSRTLSYNNASYNLEEVKLGVEFAQMYDKVVEFWGEIFEEIKVMKHLILERDKHPDDCDCEACEKGEKHPVERAGSIFWGANQRFFQQICMSAKVQHVVNLAKAAIEDGCAVVIGLQSTGEARTNANLAKGGFIKEFVSTASEYIVHVIEKHFKTGSEYQSLYEIPALTAVKRRLLQKARSFKLPDNPLDQIIDELGGPEKVAEMTGRSRRIVRGTGGELELEDRLAAAHEEETVNNVERKHFQDGQKLVAIISQASSTGISLHADRRVGNQRRRVHLTLELPWSADKAVQQLGRSHRSNQSSAPIFKLIMTDIGGEWRFASAVASRLEQLGALTHGDRRASVGASNMGDFAIDSMYGSIALRKMFQFLTRDYDVYPEELVSPFVTSDFITDAYSIDQFVKDALSSLDKLDVVDKFLKGDVSYKGLNVKTFLNRIFNIPLVLQKNIFNFFMDHVQAEIMIAKADNTYDEGILDISGEGMKVLSRETLLADSSGAKMEVVFVQQDSGISWDVAKVRLDAAREMGRNAFLLERRNKPFTYPNDSAVREVAIALDNSRGDITDRNRDAKRFRLQHPAQGYGERISFDELEQKYKVIDKPPAMSRAKKTWQEWYKRGAIKCAHFEDSRSCKGPRCKFRSRMQTRMVLVGSLITLNVWTDLIRHFELTERARCHCGTEGCWVGQEKNIRRCKHEDRLMKTVRMKMDDGERVVGVYLPPEIRTNRHQLLERVKATCEKIRAEWLEAARPLGGDGDNDDDSDTGRTAMWAEVAIADRQAIFIDPNQDGAAGGEYTERDLFKAARNGKRAMMRRIIEAGVPIDATDQELANPNGKTALIYAAESGLRSIVAVCLDLGASVDLRDTAGWSALMFAVQEDDLDCLELLAGKGANLETVDPDGMTAFLLACKNGCGPSLRCLIRNGCDKAVCDNAGNTGWQLARAASHDHILTILDQGLKKADPSAARRAPGGDHAVASGARELATARTAAAAAADVSDDGDWETGHSSSDGDDDDSDGNVTVERVVTQVERILGARSTAIDVDTSAVEKDASAAHAVVAAEEAAREAAAAAAAAEEAAAEVALVAAAAEVARLQAEEEEVAEAARLEAEKEVAREAARVAAVQPAQLPLKARVEVQAASFGQEFAAENQGTAYTGAITSRRKALKSLRGGIVQKGEQTYTVEFDDGPFANLVAAELTVLGPL